MAFGKNKQPKIDPVTLAQQQRVREEQEVNTAFQKGITALRDFIAPSSLKFENGYFHLGTRYARTFYVYGYPRQIFTGWLSSMVNLDEVMDMSFMIYPVESQVVLENLRKKVTQLEAGIQIDGEKGRGLEIGITGFRGDPTTIAQHPAQIYVEMYNGVLQVHVWDGDSQDPHTIRIEKEVPCTKVT